MERINRFPILDTLQRGPVSGPQAGSVRGEPVHRSGTVSAVVRRGQNTHEGVVSVVQQGRAESGSVAHSLLGILCWFLVLAETGQRDVPFDDITVVDQFLGGPLPLDLAVVEDVVAFGQ